ncbi:TPA: lysozyme inhibitor LprI family protein [Serratia marcescens]
MVNIINKKSLFIFSMMACSTSYAASFDCNKAVSNVEKMICSDHKLSRLDDYLSQNYKIAMGPDMPEGSKSKIRKSQIDWFDKRNACADTQCIAEMYSKQIDYLWNECFDHLSGRIDYIKFSEAIDKIKRELESQEYNRTHKKPDEVIKEISSKNASKVYKLGFDKRLLESTLFLDGFGSYFEYHTLNECLSLILELPDLTTLEKISYKGYDGFKIKIAGRPYSGFIFREEKNEIYLTGLVSGDKVIEAVTENDMRELARIFLSYANYAIDNNDSRDL